MHEDIEVSLDKIAHHYVEPKKGLEGKNKSVPLIVVQAEYDEFEESIEDVDSTDNMGKGFQNISGKRFNGGDFKRN